MTAERSEADDPLLRFPSMRATLEIARTFAAGGSGGEHPRSKPQKSPEKHRLEPCGVGERNFLFIQFY